MNRKKLVSLYIMFVSMILMASTASRSALLLTAEDSGKKVRLYEQQKLHLLLKGNPTTGYQWIVVNTDSSVIRQTGKPQVKPVADQVGAPSMITFEFQAMQPGEFEIVMHYKRVWEKDIAPIDTVKIFGKVK